MLIAGIGINSLNFNDLIKFFTVPAMIVIAVVGAFIGAYLFGHIMGLFGYEAVVTAGLCCCNIGGSGDLAVLSATNSEPSCVRVNLNENRLCADSR